MEFEVGQSFFPKQLSVYDISISNADSTSLPKCLFLKKNAENYKALLKDITKQVLSVVLLNSSQQLPFCPISTLILFQDVSLLNDLSASMLVLLAYS